MLDQSIPNDEPSNRLSGGAHLASHGRKVLEQVAGGDLTGRLFPHADDDIRTRDIRGMVEQFCAYPLFPPICIWRRHVASTQNHGFIIGLPSRV
jgi:hypothetical protein